MGNEKFLLHICCAPCAPHPLRTLKKEFSLTLYFHNPNIHPKKEYLSRLKEAERMAAAEGVPLIVGEYEPAKWIKKSREFKGEPERGKRCETCVSSRLEEVARKARELGFRRFGSVLTVSRLKSSIMINRLGKLAQEKFPGITFHDADWKKGDGEEFSRRASRQYGFKRQTYCGCIFSLRDARKKARSAAPQIADGM